MAKRINYYLPYLRQGLTTLARHDQVPGQRMKIPVSLTVSAIQQGNDTAETGTVDKELTLYGPGDVLGINEHVITRISPALGSNRFESSLVPYIEFSDPDFLWRYSSLQSPDNKSWIPWLALIVLKTENGQEEGEYEKIPNSNSELPPCIRIHQNAILPDLRESWRWVHVHKVDIEGLSAGQIKKSIESTPEKAVCRLLCPRKLQPRTSYQAFLIPVFKIGAEAGLGISDGVEDRTLFTWIEPADGLGQSIPYYFDWEFHTGTGGDFEKLVRKLKPRDLENMGTRVIDGSNPGYGLREEEGLDLQMEAALKSLDTRYQAWGMDSTAENPDDVRSKEKQVALTELLNKREENIQNENGETTTILRVTPPVYGAWHASVDGGSVKLDVDNRNHWLEELNLDFRHRAAAGLGVRFVRENQENLMKAAWEQLSKVQEINRDLRLGRFGREVSGKLYKRMEKLKPNNVLKIALPAQNAIAFEPDKTIGSVLRSSNVTRNLTQVKVRKFLAKSKSVGITSDFKPVVTTQLVNLTYQVKGLKGVKRNVRVGTETPTIMASTVHTWPQGLVDKTISALDPKMTIQSRIQSRVQRYRAIEKVVINQNMEEDPLHPVTWYPEFHRPMYHFLRAMSQEYILPGLERVPQNTVGLLQTNRRFIEAYMVGLNHEMASELRWREFPTDLRGSYFRSFWDTSIYSVDQNEKIAFRSTAIAQKLLERITKEFGNQFNTLAKIEASYLKDSPNETEKDVADAYEKAIEKWLLTRDEDKDIEKLAQWKKDVRLGNHPVAGHLNNDEEDQDQLVLLVRGELLQKFNNTLIYLVKKNVNGRPDFNQETARKHPIFEGSMPPDVVFIGFPIQKDDAPDYFVVFEERTVELRFGLDEVPEGSSPGSGVNDFSWQHFPDFTPEGYLDGHQPSIFAEEWNNAAFIGKVMMQKQVRAAIELEELLPG